MKQMSIILLLFLSFISKSMACDLPNNFFITEKNNFVSKVFSSLGVSLDDVSNFQLTDYRVSQKKCGSIVNQQGILSTEFVREFRYDYDGIKSYTKKLMNKDLSTKDYYKLLSKSQSCKIKAKISNSSFPEQKFNIDVLEKDCSDPGKDS